MWKDAMPMIRSNSMSASGYGKSIRERQKSVEVSWGIQKKKKTNKNRLRYCRKRPADLGNTFGTKKPREISDGDIVLVKHTDDSVYFAQDCKNASKIMYNQASLCKLTDVSQTRDYGRMQTVLLGIRKVSKKWTGDTSYHMFPKKCSR